MLGYTPILKNLSFKYHNNLRLSFAPSMLTYVLFANSTARDEDAIVIEKFVHAGNTCIDVGAHIGSTVLIAAQKAGPTGKVIAVEASPKFFNILSRNIDLNKKQNLASIKLMACALGDTDKKQVYLNESVSDDTTNHISSSGTAVSQTTLDTLTKDLETVDFLKIDVEGYEPQVLAGAAESLKKTKVLYIEFCTNNLTQLHHNQSDFVQLLNKNFNLYVYSQNKLADFVFDGTKEYAVNLLCLKK